MKKSIHFKTPTLLSHLDLFSMGGSDKANNESFIGKYNSGLCYSMALALRNDVDMSVKVYYQEPFNDIEDRNCETLYTISTYNQACEQTDKEKELIQITKSVSKQSFFSIHCDDYGGGDFDPEIIPTGYSVKLGIDWSLYMLLREIYSNMIDEGGCYYEDDYPEVKYGTVFTLKFEEGSEFDEIWQNRHLYINEKAPLYTINHNVDVLENEEGYLRIYKQNILVYEDEKIPSKFAYSIKSGTIDERRILSNVYSVESDITYAIKSTTNEEFLRQIITKDFEAKGQFLDGMSVYGVASDLAHKIACEVYNEFGEVNSYSWLINSIKERSDCGIGGKKIKSIGDAIYSYSNTVTVETTPETFSTPEVIETEEEVFEDSFVVEIRKHYNFNLDVEVKKAKLKGSKVISDSYNNCLIIDESFDILIDFPEFIVQYIDLTRKGNVVKEMSNFICELLKK